MLNFCEHVPSNHLSLMHCKKQMTLAVRIFFASHFFSFNGLEENIEAIAQGIGIFTPTFSGFLMKWERQEQRRIRKLISK